MGTEIKNKNDVIGMTMFPQMGPHEFRATTGVDLMLAVNKDSKKQDAAMKFIRFMSMGEGQQQWINSLQGSPVANTITYKGKVDGKLQQQSIDALNKWNSNAIGSRKLKYAELEKALVIALQNIAAGWIQRRNCKRCKTSPNQSSADGIFPKHKPHHDCGAVFLFSTPSSHGFNTITASCIRQRHSQEHPRNDRWF